MSGSSTWSVGSVGEGTSDDQDATVAVGRRSPDTGAQSHLTPGRNVGRYVVLDLLGEGAMGIVYRAYDPKLGREVAVKRLRAEIDDPEAQARMLREAHAMAQLSHPNVVAIYDVEDDPAQMHISMELVEGRTLADHLSSALDWREALTLYSSAGEGLAAAHRAGLVHRDFKASNVFVSETGQVKVGDFGIAKGVVDPEATPAVREDDSVEPDPGAMLTSASTVIGTPLFMAPEQARGVGVDAKSDQYAFCVALWWAITGHPPFAAAPFADLTRAKLQGPPAFHGPSGVPRRIADALRRGLASDPDDRWPDMDALLGELKRGLHPRRRRVWMGVGVLAAVGATFAAAAADRSPCSGIEREFASAWNDARRNAVAEQLGAASPDFGETLASSLSASMDEFARNWAKARRETCEARQVRAVASDALTRQRLRCLDDLRATFSARFEALASIDETAVAKAAALAMDARAPERCLDAVAQSGEGQRTTDDDALRSAIVEELAEASASRLLGRTEVAVEALQALEARVRPLDDVAMSVDVAVELGHAFRDAGRPRDAEERIRRAVELASAARDPRSMAPAYASLADVLAADGETFEARAYLDVARSLSERPDVDPQLQISTWATEGRLRLAQGDVDGGLEALSTAISVAQRHDGTQLRVAALQSELGDAQMKAEHADRAVAAYREAVSVWRDRFGPGHPQTKQGERNLVEARLRAGG